MVNRESLRRTLPVAWFCLHLSIEPTVGPGFFHILEAMNALWINYTRDPSGFSHDLSYMKYSVIYFHIDGIHRIHIFIEVIFYIIFLNSHWNFHRLNTQFPSTIECPNEKNSLAVEVRTTWGESTFAILSGGECRGSRNIETPHLSNFDP